MSEMERGVAIGIDLGTTYSCVAVWKHDRVEIIPNDQGSRTTPSWVAFTPSQRLIGSAAKNQVAVNPANTIYDSKRLIGRRFSDKTVQNDMKLWPFTVLSGKDDKPVIAISYKGEVKKFFPEQISSMVLVKMKETTEAYIGSEVKNAVVTVPAYFNNSQRQATKDAGTIAGLNIMRIISEPTAAAIAYGFVKHDSNPNMKARNILIFDLGGGTFDVSLVNVAKENFQVKATCGDTHLGGVDFDNNVVNYFVNEFERKHNKDMNGNHRALERLRVACERAKRSLSLNTDTTIEVDRLYEGIDFTSTLSRDQFEELNMILFEKCIETVRNCLRDAKLNKVDVNDVVLVGGSTRIPKVQELLQNYFDGKELCKSLNADEAVACGAAIQAAILSGIRHNQHFFVSDITPLSLGFKSSNGQMGTLICRNTPIPTQKSYRLDISFRNKKTRSLKVYEGERYFAEENNLLGKFNSPAYMSIARVMSTFELEVDVNSILTVKPVVKELLGDGYMSTIKHNGSLSKNEINRMVEESKKYKMEDIDCVKLGKARFEVQKFVSNMSDTLSSYGKIKSTYKKMLKDSIQQTNRWLDLNSQLNDARMFEDKLKELQHNFTDENRMKDVKEAEMKNMELSKAKLNLEKFVSNMSDTLSSYGKIKSTYKKMLKYSIQQTNRWLDFNSQLNDARMFEDKLKELRDNFPEENRMKEVNESKIKVMELRKARLDLEKFVSNMSDTLSSYGKIKSTYKKMLKGSIQQTNRWLDLNSRQMDARMFEEKLKELQDNFTEENRMKDVKESEIKDMELRKVRLDLENFVSNMSDTLSSYGKIKSTYKKMLKYSIQHTNRWLDLNSQLNDARMFEDKLKELQDNFTCENRMKEVKESKMKDMELRQAKLNLEKFVNNISDTLSSYGMIKSTYKKKLKDSIQLTNRWLNLNSQLNNVRMFEDKLKELQEIFTGENRMKEDKESKMKDMELRKARLDLEKFVSNILDNMSNYYNIKSEDKKKLKDAILETNQWLDLNVRLNDASKFEDKLKELQDICNPSSDASGIPKKSSFFFFSYEEDGESNSNVEDQKHEVPHEAEKETFKWLSSWMST